MWDEMMHDYHFNANLFKLIFDIWLSVNVIVHYTLVPNCSKPRLGTVQIQNALNQSQRWRWCFSLWVCVGSPSYCPEISQIATAWVQASTVTKISQQKQAFDLPSLQWIQLPRPPSTLTYLRHTAMMPWNTKLSQKLFLLTWKVFCHSTASSPLIICHNMCDQGRNDISMWGTGVEGL